MPLGNNLNDLYDFINRAETNRKYLPNVASNFRTPLRVIEKELSEDEKNSIDLISKNLTEIINLIYSRSSNTLSAASLGVYKRRVSQLIEDYEHYGKDPSKMASWERKTITKKHKEKKLPDDVPVNVDPSTTDISLIGVSNNDELQAADLSLTQGKGRIIVPKILSDEDVAILKFQIDILAKKIPKQ